MENQTAITDALPASPDAQAETDRAILLAAAEHEAFEAAFSLPAFARERFLAEASGELLGKPVTFEQVAAMAGPAIFEAIARCHWSPWNAGKR